jgi:hypothetical protein
VQEAKQSKLDLETQKMKLQKELLEFQLLLNAETANMDEDTSNTDEELSPRTPAVKQFEVFGTNSDLECNQ